MTFIIQQIVRNGNGRKSASFVKTMERQDKPAEFRTLSEAEAFAEKLPGFCYIYRLENGEAELVD